MNRKRLPPMLEQAIRAGLMTRDEAERVDAWADVLVGQKLRGEVSEAEVWERVEERATADALEKLRRRQS